MTPLLELGLRAYIVTMEFALEREKSIPLELRQEWWREHDARMDLIWGWVKKAAGSDA